MAEQWRSAPGHEEYEVSDAGQVRRVRPASGARVGKLLKIQVGTHGRQYVSLSRESRVTDRFVHHLVLEAFVGPRPPGHECCHYDGDPLNNRLDNLRWDTPKNNCADKKRHGTDTHPAYSRKGELHPSSRLTEADVLVIREQAASGELHSAIARRYGLHRSTISDLVRRKTWRHL